MATDFVFPNDNEEEFISIASRLGYNKLIFVYNYGVNLTRIKEKISKLKFDVEIGLLAFPKYIVKAKKLTKYVFVKSSKDNRFVFEKNKDILVYNLEDTGKRDFIHHRSSSLNQVLCGLANKNNIKVGLSFNSLLKADPIPRAKILGRMKQNIKLCNKYKVSTLVASFANKPYEMRNNKDLESFF